jgi:hypothetical protein
MAYGHTLAGLYNLQAGAIPQTMFSVRHPLGKGEGNA